MNFLNIFKKKKPGTGEGQIFKDGLKALAFEVYRGISILHVAQLEGEKLTHKYMFYTTKEGEERREDTLHSGTAADLDQLRDRAMAAVDKLVN